MSRKRSTDSFVRKKQEILCCNESECDGYALSVGSKTEFYVRLQPEASLRDFF